MPEIIKALFNRTSFDRLGRSSNYLFSSGILFLSIIFIVYSKHTASNYLIAFLFAFFAIFSAFLKTNLHLRRVPACIAISAIFVSLFINPFDVKLIISLLFWLPFVSIYLYKSHFLTIFMGVIGSLAIFISGHGTIEAAAAYSIGYLSENIAYTMIFYLVQSLKKERDNLKIERDNYFELSITDSLTGLPTLSHTIEVGEKMLNGGNDITLLILDIDHFKQINDTYGHLAGNRALVHFSGLLKEALRGYDHVLGRLGGDEFIILLRNLPVPHELSLIKYLYVFISSYEFYADSDMPPIKLTFSAGMVKSKSNRLASIESLIHQADSRMYENKYGEYQLSLEPNLEDTLPKRCREILLALKEKDMYTYIHSEYAARYAASLGKALNLPAETVNDLYLAGWLHDIGKILISVDILRKPFQLTEQEYQCVKEHVTEGLNIIDIFSVSDTVKKAVKYHHERWDGLGYPSGSAKNEIPIEGRILKIADVFSAITIKRVYREKLSLDEALAEIKRCSGTDFDPQLVDAFEGLFQK